MLMHSVPLKGWQRQLIGMQDGHWSELTVHCSLFLGPACLSFVAAYGIDSSQAELYGFVCKRRLGSQ